MNITGRFKSIDNEHYYDVVITTPTEGRDIYIGNDENSDVFFDEDPVTITTNCEDLFTHIITTQARISLCSKIWLGDYLFANNVISNTVNISRDGISIFDGFVEHNTFSQPYAREWNILEINCIDHLGVLEYMKMSDLVDYDEMKENQDIHTIRELLNLILANPGDIYYDGSKRVKSEYDRNSVRFDYYLSICDGIWLGESEDDVWTQYDLLNEILRYLNLHIIQHPDVSVRNRTYSYYIFDWQYYKTDSGVAANYHTWYKLSSTTTSAVSQQITRELVVLDKDDYAGTDTNLSIDMVYNKISVKESGEDYDVIISNPLDTSSLNSPYNQFNRYMTEFVGLGTGRTAKRTLRGMISGDPNANWNESNGWFRHWYIKYIYNPQWQFNTYQHTASTTSSTLGWTPIIKFDDTLTPAEGTDNITKDQYDYLSTDPLYETDTLTSFSNSQDQWSMTKAAWYRGAVGPKYFRYYEDTTLQQYIFETGDPITYPVSNGLIVDAWTGIYMPVRMPNCIGATMVEQWSTGKINPQDDTTPIKKENSGKWLYINVGNMLSDTVYNDIVGSEHGVCEYLTKTSSSLIPPSDDIQYHLVFTGKIVLNPFITKVWNYWGARNGFYALPDDHSNQGTNSKFSYGMGGPSDSYYDGWTQYCRLYYDGTEPLTNLGDVYNQTHWVQPDTVNVNGDNMPLYIRDDGIKAYQYKEDRNNPGDTIKKVGVLLCKLRIGDKYLSEGYEKQTIDEVDYYFPNNEYSWSDDSTSTFTIGFNPKIGDWIIGQEYQIGTDISTYLNIDSNYGLDIPITREDNLSGKIEFTIIGPEATGWSDNYYRHRTWFRHSKVWTNTINLFNQNIQNTVGGVTITDPKRLSKAVANIAIGELKCTLYSDNGMNTFFQENDIIYMSDDTNKYVEDNELEFKLISGFTTGDTELFGITNKPLMNTVLNAKKEPNLVLDCRYNPADSEGPLTKPEKQYVNQYFNLYNRPMILFNSTLKYTDNLMYFRRYQIGYLNDKIFNPIAMSIDLKYQTNTITMRQYES